MTQQTGTRRAAGGPRRRRAPLGWLLALATSVSTAPACEVTSVSLAPAGGDSARLRIEHDGGAGFRQRRDDARLVLFIEHCNATAGLHEVPRTHAPVSAVRWSHHADSDAVWVVLELPADARVEVSAEPTAFEVKLTGTAVASRPRRWPLGFRVVQPLPAAVREIMTGTWRSGCPVPLDDLSLVQVTHVGFDGRQHQGDLIVHASLAAEVVDVFAGLLAIEFPIQRVRLAAYYGGDDAASMADNNSSAFNCRLATGSSSRYSVHSYGRAIDLNPVQNPYVRGDVVLPPAGRGHLDRNRPASGRILAGDAVERVFTSRGWRWGGSWQSLRDYQHFEKP